MHVRSTGGYCGAALPGTEAAVYQHNQTDLEFLVAAAASGCLQDHLLDGSGGSAVAGRDPARMSCELMFDGVTSGPRQVGDARNRDAAMTIKGSTVNINLVAPTSHVCARWEGPDLDA